MSEQNDFNRQLIEEFRANGGKVSGRLANTPLLLLTTTGARSGLPRITPLGYMPYGDRLLVVASNLGSPNHPDWYRNLVTHPQVTIEIGSETFEATAVVIEGTERDRLWARAVASYPFLAEHQAKTTRQIPIVALVRRNN